MSVALTVTWNPRGETERFRRFYPEFSRWYAGVAVVTPPDPDAEAMVMVGSLREVRVQKRGDWVAGRQLSLELALEFDCDYVHYVDCDRLLHWFELHPDELRETIDALQTVDCLVIGRTEAAFATHPRCLMDTERITNDVFSHLLGQPLDLCAGSKAFSREAAEFLVRNSQPSHGWCTDAEWIVLLRRRDIRLTRCWWMGWIGRRQIGIYPTQQTRRHSGARLRHTTLIPRIGKGGLEYRRKAFRQG